MSKKVRRSSHNVNQTGHQPATKVSAVLFVPGNITASDSNRSDLDLWSNSFGFQRVHILGFILLSSILLAVLFLLPKIVTSPVPENITRPAPEPIVVPPPPDSPWNDAQLAKQRREAQEVLSQILTIQEKLEAKNVKQWAAQDYQLAMDTAANGDVQYRQRNFTDAQQSYRDSLHQFKSLIARVDSIFDAQVSTGKQAIIDAQAQQAIDSYQLALYLKPDSQAAQQGLARAEAQSSVIKLVHKGTELMKRKQLKEAKQAFSEALTYDSQSKPAQQQLALVKQAIIDDNFARSMSGGFNALNARQFVKAIKAFNRAAKIKPANKEAQDARVQAKNNHVEAQITGYFEQGEAFEQVEKWLLANDQYQQVLELDKTVIKARVSEIRSGVRAQLDDDLTQMLDNPQRLASQNVYNQARKLYRDAIGIKNRGPVLAGQITSLKQWLTNIKQPVALQLKSDNQTLVTLYKIGELGSFTAKNMDLKPGKYTVIGTRSGYRDIRREFTLEPNKALTTIVVQCEEKIRL